ncbi:MAG: methyltransferase domain-containing protein [Proteobacteria bacterium]|nr:methyltransferase domain-containing protein [Pseudomonadota bacterium]
MAQINALCGAMVRLIAAEARLGLPAQRWLDSGLIEHLRGRPATEQRRWLVDLAGSPSTRQRLADAASPRDPSRGAPTSHPISASSAPRREPGVRWSDEVERLYDGIAPAWNAIVSRPRIDPIRDAEARQLLDALQLREGDRVANIGIGAGDFESRTGAPKRVGDAAWLGIDVSGAMLREAAQRHPGIELLKADFLDLPQGLTFEKCVAHHVLCHVRDLDGALQAIFERLPEGGLFTFIERVASHHDLDGLVLDRRYPTIPESALRESMSRLEFERTSVEFLDAIQRGNWGSVRSRPVTLDSLQLILVK